MIRKGSKGKKILEKYVNLKKREDFGLLLVK